MKRRAMVALVAIPVLVLPTTPTRATADDPGTTASCPAPRATVHESPATYPKTVALTFDDGPSVYTPKVLAVLRRYGVKATFFETGAHVARHPALARRVAEAGMWIGNHTYTHPQPVAGSSPYGAFDRLPARTQAAQIDRTTAAITRATGRTPCFFRAPGGHDGSAVMRRLVRQRGMTVVNWSLSSGDSAQPAALTAASYTALARRSTRHPGNHPVLLLHDGKASPEPESAVSSRRRNTVKALPTIIRWYRSHGYVFTDPVGRTG